MIPPLRIPAALLVFLTVFPFLSSSLAAKKPLEIWVNSFTDQKYYQNMVALYQKKVDKNFKANIKSFGFMEMPDKLAVAIKSGVNTPDIVQMDEMFFSMYLAHEVPFLELSDRIKKAKLDEGILPQRLGLFSFNGKTYGLPQSVSGVVIFYRSDLFSEFGFAPEALDTWDKFIQAGQKIKKPNQAMLAMDWSYWEILVKQRGSDLFKKDGSPNFDDPIVLETLEWIQKFIKDGNGRNPDRGSIYDPSFFAGDVVNNEILCIMAADWYGLDMIQSMSPQEIKGKWAAMPLPKWTDKKSNNQRNTSTFSGQGLMIYKNSKAIEDSWKFMEWVMTDIDANVERYLQGNSFTPFRPAWVDLRFSKKDKAFGGQSLGNLMIELANNIPAQNQSPVKALVVNLLREKYWQQLVSDSITPKKLLEEISNALKDPKGAYK